MTKLPQILGLDYDDEIRPKLEQLRIECDGNVCRKLSTEELRQKVLMKPSALGVEVRGAYKTSSAR